MERTRVLMYSEHSPINYIWLAGCNDFYDIFCVSTMDEAENMLMSFTFHLILIDFTVVSQYEKITAILYQRNLASRIIVVPESAPGDRPYEIRAPSLIQTQMQSQVTPKKSKKMKEAEEKAGIEKDEVLKFDELVIDPNEMRVKFGRKNIKMTLIQFKLLYLLASHSNNVITYKQIKIYLWGDELYGDETVKTHIYRIRQKLSVVSDREYIESERSVGYRFLK